MLLARLRNAGTIGIAALATNIAVAAHADESAEGKALEKLVDSLARPLMAEHDVPGMAVAVVDGNQRRIFTYGVTAPDGNRPVGEATIFEIGSLSKPYTATLAAYAEATGQLSMSATVASLIPQLEGSPAGNARLRDLGTYSAGGLPLQFPDTVVDHADMLAYYGGWEPDHDAGTVRLYSNPSIGLFGHLAAKSLGGDFTELMETRLLSMLGLHDTFVDVPADRMEDYAFGLSRDGRAVRVNPGMFDAEAYGIKTTASDLLSFVELNIDPSDLPQEWQRAVRATHSVHYRVGPMMQGLGWELYEGAVVQDDLLAGNSSKMALEPNRIEVPTLAADAPVLINKTGSTAGFGAYAAFIPSERIGVAILANRNFPIPARVAFAYEILSKLQ
jgi:beta-lactamase class C